MNHPNIVPVNDLGETEAGVSHPHYETGPGVFLERHFRTFSGYFSFFCFFSQNTKSSQTEAVQN